jgi:serine/threonine-protein kinase
MDNTNEEFKSVCKKLIEINKIRIISMKEMKLTKHKKDKLGEGGQAIVYHGTLDGKIDVAVKTLTDIDWKSLSNELIIISNIVHDNIPKFYGIITENNKIEMVFQYVEGKTLDEYKDNAFAYFSSKEKLEIVKSLAGAIETIFKNNFIHRDLKPENIMIDLNKKPYIIDFGIAKVLMEGSQIPTRAKGTLNYVAPEVFEEEEGGDENSDMFVSLVYHKVDVWAFGCIISYLYSGCAPWTPKLQNNENLIMDALRKKKPFPIPGKVTDEGIRNIINMCC